MYCLILNIVSSFPTTSSVLVGGGGGGGGAMAFYYTFCQSTHKSVHGNFNECLMRKILWKDSTVFVVKIVSSLELVKDVISM